MFQLTWCIYDNKIQSYLPHRIIVLFINSFFPVLFMFVYLSPKTFTTKITATKNPFFSLCVPCQVNHSTINCRYEVNGVLVLSLTLFMLSTLLDLATNRIILSFDNLFFGLNDSQLNKKFPLFNEN